MRKLFKLEDWSRAISASLLLTSLPAAYLVEQPIDAAVRIEQLRNGDDIRVMSASEIPQRLSQPLVVVKSIPWTLREDGPPSPWLYEELLYADTSLLSEEQWLALGSDFRLSIERPEGSEVRTLISQGPKENRIDLTIVGDGYTEDERERFFEDAHRTAAHLFKAKAFSSYLPLFNVYAVFVPSNESGISDIERLDTALGLYRDPPGSKRAIMPGNTRAIEAALALAPATDYPILIANDEFYGGLGGRYAITTRSVESGAIVLRHELGHNFGDVGEEYDGGYVYDGANFSRSESAPWAYWSEEPLKVYKTKFLSGRYVWQNLAKGPFRTSFQVPRETAQGAYHIFFNLSTVGWETEDDVSTLLNGHQVPLQGRYTADRGFLSAGPIELPAGNHTLEIRQSNSDDDNVLAFVQILAQPPDYDYSPHKLGAFATFDSRGSFRGYRPTHNSCIMRQMLLDHFCVVDRENFWRKFLARVSLIDGVEVKQAERRVTLMTPKLPHLQVRWFRVDHEREALDELHNRFEWSIPEDWTGRFQVEVELRTPEIRNPKDRTIFRHDFRL